MVAACLPHSKPPEAHLFDELAFGAYPQNETIKRSCSPQENCRGGVPNEVASSKDTITSEVAL